MNLTEQIYQTQYTCQCGQVNTATLSLNNAIDQANYGKQYWEVQAYCPHCQVQLAMKFNTVPFEFADGDPYKSSIFQNKNFFKFDLEQAVRRYKISVRWKLEEALRELGNVANAVEAPDA